MRRLYPRSSRARWDRLRSEIESPIESFWTLRQTSSNRRSLPLDPPCKQRAINQPPQQASPRPTISTARSRLRSAPPMIPAFSLLSFRSRPLLFAPDYSTDPTKLNRIATTTAFSIAEPFSGTVWDCALQSVDHVRRAAPGGKATIAPSKRHGEAPPEDCDVGFRWPRTAGPC